MIERFLDALLTKFDSSLDRKIVVWAEAGERSQAFKRKHNVAEIYATVRVKAIHDARNRRLVMDTLFQSLGNYCLG